SVASGASVAAGASVPSGAGSVDGAAVGAGASSLEPASSSSSPPHAATARATLTESAPRRAKRDLYMILPSNGGAERRASDDDPVPRPLPRHGEVFDDPE